MMKPEGSQAMSATRSGFFLIQLVLVTTAFFATSLNPLLQFDRSAIHEGELWRLVTGHFVHLGNYHALMNMVGLGLIQVIFATEFTCKKGFVALLFITLCISLALLAFSPQIEWYLGFSGVLYGLLALGLTLNLGGQFSVYWVGLIALVVKVGFEQTPAYDVNHLMSYIHAPVVVDAHLYGMVAAMILGAFWNYCRFRSRDRQQSIVR